MPITGRGGRRVGWIPIGLQELPHDGPIVPNIPQTDLVYLRLTWTYT